MYLAKLSNEKIGCYHSKPSSTQNERKVEPSERQRDMDGVLDQIDQLEAIQAEFGSICTEIKELMRIVSKSN